MKRLFLVFTYLIYIFSVIFIPAFAFEITFSASELEIIDSLPHYPGTLAPGEYYLVYAGDDFSWQSEPFLVSYSYDSSYGLETSRFTVGFPNNITQYSFIVAQSPYKVGYSIIGFLDHGSSSDEPTGLPTSGSFTFISIEETNSDTVITLDDLERVGSDMLHADLFGSFLVCGTLIGLALLRNIHGT